MNFVSVIVSSNSNRILILNDRSIKFPSETNQKENREITMQWKVYKRLFVHFTKNYSNV